MDDLFHFLLHNHHFVKSGSFIASLFITRRFHSSFICLLYIGYKEKIYGLGLVISVKFINFSYLGGSRTWVVRKRWDKESLSSSLIFFSKRGPLTLRLSLSLSSFKQVRAALFPFSSIRFSLHLSLSPFPHLSQAYSQPILFCFEKS